MHFCKWNPAGRSFVASLFLEVIVVTRLAAFQSVSVNLSWFNKYRESSVFFQEKIANMIRICNLGQDLGSLHSSLASLIPSTPRGGDSLWSLLQWRWCTTSSEQWRCRLSERGKGNKMFTAMLQWADPTRATDKSPRSTTVQCFVPQTHGIHPTMFHNCERSRGH